MQKPQSWENCDNDIKIFIENTKKCIVSELESNLSGIYLHGSLAMGSYYRPKSDIDVLVVVSRPLTPSKVKSTALSIARIAEKRPTVGSIELSVITDEVAKQIPVPTPYEVHYSSSWHEKIIQDKVTYGKQQTDIDLLSHITYVIQRGICLYGQFISDVFGKMKWEFFLTAVMDDLQWILEDEHIIDTPYYSVLNICRVLQLLSQDTETVHSKDEGGKWGLRNLPHQFHPLINQALEVYHSSEYISEEQRKTGGHEWDSTSLLTFRDFARSSIKNS